MFGALTSLVENQLVLGRSVHYDNKWARDGNCQNRKETFHFLQLPIPPISLAFSTQISDHSANRPAAFLGAGDRLWREKTMTLLQIKYALTCAKCSSLTKAAEVLYLSPSNLSKTLKALEEELQKAIFER